jgi:ATP-dependent RNA helicase DeaD
VDSKVTRHRQQRAFDQLGLSDAVLAALARAGFTKPTPIQAAVIPLAMQGLDVIGQARTGTGKTAAFVLPLVQMIDRSERATSPQALVLVPTRELAVQVHAEFTRLTPEGHLHCVAVYGGKSIQRQIHKLKEGVHVVVGTPGRLIDHMGRGTLRMDRIAWVVMDEADRMLDIGFRPDIERILRRCPSQRQTLMFSATVPAPIRHLALRYMNQPKLINLSAQSVAVESIEQWYFLVDPKKKLDLLVALLEREQPQQAIIFCRTKLGTLRLHRQLERSGKFQSLETMHGDMSQPDRDRTMAAFRAGTVQILVATDVVGRGIDVSSISHIINYDIPELADDYVHRVGRTGRMGRQGVAFTLITLDQRDKLAEIERLINRPLKEDRIAGFEPPEIPPPPAITARRQRRYRRAL